MKKTKIAIIGLGWFGLPLATELYRNDYEVSGSTTSTEKFADLVNQPFNIRRLIVKSDGVIGNLDQFLFGIDILVLNIPPNRKKKAEAYVEQVKIILNALNTTTKVVFISSTSVYGMPNSEVNESSELNPVTEGGKAVFAAENLIKNAIGERATIVRFAGLVGPDRHPGRFLSKGKSLSNPNGYINLIHLEDCIQIVTSVIQQDVWGETLNGCADVHPKRIDFYTAAAYDLSLAPPDFDEEKNSSFKIVDNTKSKSILNLKYKMSNPIEFLFS